MTEDEMKNDGVTEGGGAGLAEPVGWALLKFYPVWGHVVCAALMIAHDNMLAAWFAAAAAFFACGHCRWLYGPNK